MQKNNLSKWKIFHVDDIDRIFSKKKSTSFQVY